MADAKVEVLITLKDQFTNAMKGVSKNFQDVSRKMRNAGKTLTAAVTLPIVGLGAVAIKTAADLEALETAFKVMLGSAEEAKKLMEDLKEFSASTPFQLNDLAEGTKKLLAFGVEADDVIKTMQMLGDTASGDAQKLGSLTLAFGKTFAKGKASMEELNMIIDAGVPILAQLGEQMGATNEEVIKMASQGKISAQELTTAFEELTGEGGMFFEGMAEQSRTLSGLFSTLKDNVSLALGQIGTDLIETINLKELVGSLTVKIQELAEWFTNLGPTTKTVIFAIAGILAVAGPLLVMLGFLLPAITAIGVALAFLAANPIVLVIAAIAALAVAWQTNLFGIQEKVAAFVAYIDERLGGLLTIVWEKLGEMLNAFVDTFAEIYNAVVMTYDVLKTAWTEFYESHKAQIEAALAVIKAIFDVTFAAIKAIVQVAWAFFSTTFEAAWGILTNLVQAGLALLRGDFDAAFGFITGAWESFWGGLKDYAMAIIDSVIGFVDNLVGAVVGLINKLKSLIGLSGSASSSFSFVGQAASYGGAGPTVSGLIGGVQTRQAGGPVNAGNPYLVGEAGPELFVPRGSGDIISNKKMASGGTTVVLTGNTFLSEDAAEQMGDMIIKKLGLNTQF